LNEVLNAKDFNKEGLISNEDIITAITDKKVTNL
jgi:hypothetical protein